MDILEKLKGLKKRKLSDEEKEAKLGALEKYSGKSKEGMLERLGGVKKVSVIAKDKDGLEEGLDKAKEILEDEDLEESELSDDFENEQDEEDSDDEDELSLDDIEEKIRELEALKKAKLKG